MARFGDELLPRPAGRYLLDSMNFTDGLALAICLLLQPHARTASVLFLPLSHGPSRKGGRTMAKRLMPFIAAVIVFAWAPVASAQFWSAPGFVGIVDEADMSIHVFGSNGAVAIRSSVARGTLNVRYPILVGGLGEFFPPESGDCTQIRAILRDTGPGARVIVRLMRLSIGGDLVLGELSSLAEIDSDTRPPAAQPNQYSKYSACLTEDPGALGDFTYFVEVQLIKTTATANPGLMSLQICNNADACDP